MTTPDLAPISSLFRAFVAELPEGWLKFVVLLALVFGFGALLATKTDRRLSSSDYFIWWDK
jgi:hypothetical protein